MDPVIMVLLSLFGLVGLILLVVGIDAETAPAGSLGGMLLFFVVLFAGASYRDTHYTENRVLIENGIACYVGSPTNATVTFMLIDKDGHQVKP